MIEPGTPLPQFKLDDHNGNTVTNDSLRGHWTVLWWYAKADTPG